MAPERKPARAAVASEPDGMFRGVSAFVVPPPRGRAPPRSASNLLSLAFPFVDPWVQVWKQRLVQMGGRVQEKLAKGAAVTHVLPVDAKALLRELDAAWLHRFRGSVMSFEWLEECLKSGKSLPEHKFVINYEEEFKPKKAAGTGDSGASQPAKRSKMPPEGPENHKETSAQDREKVTAGGHRDEGAHVNEDSGVEKRPNQHASSQSSSGDTKDTIGSHGTFEIEGARSEAVTPRRMCLSGLTHLDSPGWNLMNEIPSFFQTFL